MNGKQATQTKRTSGRVPGRARRWLPYLAGLLLIAAIVAGLWPKPISVETAKVLRGPLRATVNEEGKTRVKQRYVVSAPVSGQLRRISFKAGAAVEQGRTVVAVIDPLLPSPLDARARSTAEASRDAAAASLAKAKVSYEFARSEFERFKKLYAEKTVSAQEYEMIQLREAAASRDVAAAESSLRQVEAQLAEFMNRPSTNATPREVLAPVSGKILRVFEESARAVAAGTPLMEIGDPTDLEVIVEVLSRDGAIIQPGMKVEFEQWGGGAPLLGTVRLVEPGAFTKVSALGVEEQRVYVVADLDTPPSERGNLGDSFRVEARIITWSDPAALKVPAGALFRQGDAWAAFVVEEDRARLRRVEAGESSGLETRVLDGLREGETVIIYPGSRVEEGARVEPIRIER